MASLPSLGPGSRASLHPGRQHKERPSSCPAQRRPTTHPNSHGQPNADRQPLRRREISVTILKCDVRLYRRTRTSADVSRCPPHFVYHMRIDVSGQPGERKDWKALRSPRRAQSPDPRRPNSRSSAGSSNASLADAPNGGPWWDALPERYFVKRRWQDLTRFHEALTTNLAVDPGTGCNRVKGKIPMLPSKGDLDAWLHAYAATEDACALSRKLPLAPPALSVSLGRNIQAQMADLDGLHWVYVEQRLAPYFQEVNKILRELPTEILASSAGLFNLIVPGSKGLRERSVSMNNSSSAPVFRKRFMGKAPLVPCVEDINEAWRRQQSAKQRAASQPQSPKSHKAESS
mmetsp:Transcript_77642/g.128671  ORF Transcript_77642/g.128671 Transcript_77642/m.128671 type:complete len:346 (-) Transcript_77642:35-1072(-)